VAPTFHHHQASDCPPSRLVVVEIHQVPHLSRLFQQLLVGGIDKPLGELDSVPKVITAASPFPALWGVSSLGSPVTVALGEISRGAGSRHGVDHPSRCDRVQKRRLL